MDTFPAQDTAQPIPIQQPIVPSPVQVPPQNKSFRKFFNIGSWIVLFALAPLTVLIFLSQDSIPGDLFYPVKRSLENVILAAASVNPATRAAFRTDLTETRFKEAQSLVISKSNASGLSTFIDDVQSTKFEVANLKDDSQRIKAEEKLINKLEEYENGLSVLEAKTEQNVIAYNLAENIPPTSTPIPPTITPSPAPKNSTYQSQSFPQPSVTSIPTPTVISLPTTSIPAITIVPTITSNIETPQESVQVLEQKKIVQTLKETKEQLHKIRKDLEEKRSEEKRSEEKEKREKRNEEKEKHEEGNNSEKKDKEDGEKRDNSDRNK